VREKARNNRGQKKIAGWRWCCQAQYAGRLAAEFIRRFQRRLILVKHRPKPPQETLAGCSWGNRSRRPLDQAHPEPFLEVTDQFAHARRRQSELLGRLGEAFELNHRHKGCGFGEAWSRHRGDPLFEKPE
jgi:hypothetical protein